MCMKKPARESQGNTPGPLWPVYLIKEPALQRWLDESYPYSFTV